MNCIVITGATSMIGISIIDAVMKYNPDCRIYAVVRENSSNNSRLLEYKNIIKIECNADNYQMLPQMIHEKCDVFYHIAWISTGPQRNDDMTIQCENIKYTLNALDAAYNLGVDKFIGAGSQAEYGIKDVEKISPNMPVEPVQAYGVAKFAAGKLARMQAKKYGMDCLWVRIFSVYGKWELKTTMIQSTVQKLQNGISPSFTPSEQMWDYLYSEDAGEAFYLLGEKAKGNKVYCLGSGKKQPLKEYISVIGRLVNPTIPLGIGDLPYPPNAVMNLCADISDLTEDTGWEPKTRFEDGIAKILEYAREDV